MADKSLYTLLALGGLAAVLWSRDNAASYGTPSSSEPDAVPSSPAPFYEPATPNDTPPLDQWPSLLEPDPVMTPTEDFRRNDYPLYAQYIADTERHYGIPTDVLARLLYMECRYRADIINGTTQSAVGAAGIAQFMPDTAAQYGLMTGGIDGRLDPQRAIPAAGRYLKSLYSTFRSWVNAAAAYNWGPGNLRHYLAGDVHKSGPLKGQPYVMPQETVDYIAYITPGGDAAFA